MSEDAAHKIYVMIGLFIVSCLASTIFYGFDMVIVMLVGLFVAAAALNAFRNATGGQ